MANTHWNGEVPAEVIAARAIISKVEGSNPSSPLERDAQQDEGTFHETRKSRIDAAERTIRSAHPHLDGRGPCRSTRARIDAAADRGKGHAKLADQSLRLLGVIASLSLASKPDASIAGWSPRMPPGVFMPGSVGALTSQLCRRRLTAPRRNPACRAHWRRRGGAGRHEKQPSAGLPTNRGRPRPCGRGA